MDFQHWVLFGVLGYLAFLSLQRFGVLKRPSLSKLSPAMHTGRAEFAGLVAARHWADDDETEVVGEAHYRAAIAQIAGNAKSAQADVTCTAFLVPEGNNKHDKNAVAVVIEGRRVGYLSREDASEFRERLRQEGLAAAVTSCMAHIGWGGTGGNGQLLSYSVTLQLSAFADD